MCRSSKIPFLILAFCSVVLAFGQPETEVFLADLNIGAEAILDSSPLNISNNPGYDNQPSFLEDGTLLYARTRNGQTDIARYNLKEGTTSWISNTPGGSEYSPLKIPGREAVSAIRLDTTGLQRLYAYPLQGGAPTLLVEGLKIGYHLWIDPELLVCTILIWTWSWSTLRTAVTTPIRRMSDGHFQQSPVLKKSVIPPTKMEREF
jgi:hypothetical protein